MFDSSLNTVPIRIKADNRARPYDVWSVTINCEKEPVKVSSGGIDLHFPFRRHCCKIKLKEERRQNMSDEPLTTIRNKLNARIDELKIIKYNDWSIGAYFAGYSKAMEDAIYILFQR